MGKHLHFLIFLRRRWELAERVAEDPLSQDQKKLFSNICSFMPTHIHFGKASYMIVPKLGAEWWWGQSGGGHRNILCLFSRRN